MKRKWNELLESIRQIRVIWTSLHVSNRTWKIIYFQWMGQRNFNTSSSNVISFFRKYSRGNNYKPKTCSRYLQPKQQVLRISPIVVNLSGKWVLSRSGSSKKRLNFLKKGRHANRKQTKRHEKRDMLRLVLLEVPPIAIRTSLFERASERALTVQKNRVANLTTIPKRQIIFSVSQEELELFLIKWKNDFWNSLSIIKTSSLKIEYFSRWRSFPVNSVRD